jgi:hypothetical protein
MTTAITHKPYGIEGGKNEARDGLRWLLAARIRKPYAPLRSGGTDGNERIKWNEFVLEGMDKPKERFGPFLEPEGEAKLTKIVERRREGDKCQLPDCLESENRLCRMSEPKRVTTLKLPNEATKIFVFNRSLQGHVCFRGEQAAGNPRIYEFRVAGDQGE